MITPKPKPRLLIPITVQFSVRYIIRTGLLTRLQGFCEPIVVLSWDDPLLIEEINAIGVDVYRNPDKVMGVPYYRLRNRLSAFHFEHLSSPTTDIDRRRNRKFRSFSLNLRLDFRDILFHLESKILGKVEKWKQSEPHLLQTDTNFCEYQDLVRKIQPDLIFCTTPYFMEEEFLVRAGQSLGIPLATAILSFDNITTRGWIPLDFDEYYLWNKYNVEELFRIYPKTKEKTVKVVGAPQFDFYYDPKNIWNEDYWRQHLQLPPDRPVILFSSTGKHIAPNEEDWLIDIDRAIDSQEIQGFPIVLFRRHPNETIARWDKLKKESKHIIFDEPWTAGEKIPGKTNMTLFDIQKLSSSLYHSPVHVNASSTMTVDGAIFNKPQIGPAYDENGKFHQADYEIYLREHYLPITKSGGLDIVRSRKEMNDAINLAFTHPNRLEAGRRRIVEEICSFSDGQATKRVSDALYSFVKKYSGGDK